MHQNLWQREFVIAKTSRRPISLRIPSRRQLSCLTHIDVNEEYRDAFVGDGTHGQRECGKGFPFTGLSARHQDEIKIGSGGSIPHHGALYQAVLIDHPRAAAVRSWYSGLLQLSEVDVNRCRALRRKPSSCDVVLKHRAARRAVRKADSLLDAVDMG